MKGLEKLTCIRLAEVLSQRGSVTTDAITEALYTQDKTGEPFVELLVGSGHIAEWELAKVVVENFQLPFIMGSNYDISKEATAKLPETVWFETGMVPLDLFENVLTVVMPIMIPFETLDKLQKKNEIEFFPYVGLPSENRKLLGELFKGYADWRKKSDAEREARLKQRAAAGAHAGGSGKGDSWMNIFDSADAAVRDDLKKK